MDFEERIKIMIQECNSINYSPTTFIRMMNTHGTIDAVKRLINKSAATDGFTKLWELGRLDLSLEKIILEPEWESLFTQEEREKATKKLQQYEYSF